MAGNLRKALSTFSQRFGNHTVKNNSANNPALALADLYRGNFDFIDDVTSKKHRLTISDKLDIGIDGKKLPGKIVGISTDALTFIDHYGYQLIIKCEDGYPVTIFDEAENQTYVIIYPNLDVEAEPVDDEEAETE